MKFLFQLKPNVQIAHFKNYYYFAFMANKDPTWVRTKCTNFIVFFFFFNTYWHSLPMSDCSQKPITNPVVPVGVFLQIHQAPSRKT